MRAREFILEQAHLEPEQSEPMRQTYVLPGLSASDPYNNYRFGVALARARAQEQDNDVNPFMPEWSKETAFGEHGVVVGMNAGIRSVIDQALRMTGTPGGKKLITTPDSVEPSMVNTHSPIRGFRGYPR